MQTPAQPNGRMQSCRLNDEGFGSSQRSSLVLFRFQTAGRLLYGSIRPRVHSGIQESVGCGVNLLKDQRQSYVHATVDTEHVYVAL